MSKNECNCVTDKQGNLHPRRDCPVHGQAARGGKGKHAEDK